MITPVRASPPTPRGLRREVTAVRGAVAMALTCAACNGAVAPAAPDARVSPPKSEPWDAALVNSDGGARPVDATVGVDGRVDSSSPSACAHDCLDGAYVADAGEPVVLVTVPSPGVASFAIDSTSVYWTSLYAGTGNGVPPSNGIVAKCPLTGCVGAATSLATGQDFPDAVWVNGSTLYWRDYNTPAIMQCSVDCNDDPTTFLHSTSIPMLGFASGFAPTATEVFFASTTSDIAECPSAGCEQPTAYASGQQNPDDIVVSGSSVYWIDLGTEVVSMSASYLDGGVMTCPIAGCADAATALATGLSYPLSLVVDSKNAYWAEGSEILACSVEGCGGAPTVVASVAPTSAQVWSLAVDATDVYFTSVAQGEGAELYWVISRCPLAGCSGSPTRLFASPFATGNPTRTLAVDATRVYFVSGDSTQILALAK